MVILSIVENSLESEISSEKSGISKKRKRCFTPENIASSQKCEIHNHKVDFTVENSKIMRCESASNAVIRKIFQEYVGCLQSYDPAQYSRFFQKHCHDNVLLSVLTVRRDHGQEKLGKYRQIMGRDAAMAFLLNEQLCFPDGVVRLVLENIEVCRDEALEGASYIIHCKASFEGHRVYTLDATDLDCAFRDAEAVESVLTGLASLATSCSNPCPDTSSDHLHACHTKSMCDELLAATDPSTSFYVTHSLEDKPVYLSTSKASFSRCRLPKAYHCAVEGRVQLFLSAQLSIIKIKYYC